MCDGPNIVEELSRANEMLDSVKEKLILLSSTTQNDILKNLADQGFFLEMLENVSIAKELLEVTKTQFAEFEQEQM